MLYEKYLFVEADECNPCCCGDPWSIWRTGHLQAGRGRLVTPVSRLPTLPAVQGNTEHSLPDQRDQRQP